MKGVAVVTGMARTAGIGHAICSSLLECGHSVIGIDQVPLEQQSPLWTRERSNSDAKFISKLASVTDLHAIKSQVTEALSEMNESHIAVVVNNAGIAQPFLQSPPSTSKDSSDLDVLSARLEEFDQYLQVNLRSAFLVTEVCRPFFLDTGVSIIHVSSTRARQSPVAGDECPFGQDGYAAAKAGMIGLMHSQGQALTGQARVNAVLPGWIDTQDTDAPDHYQPTKEDQEWHAVGRIGKPSDVAEIVAFLADDVKSGFITCQEFVVDGGVSRKMVYPD